MPTIETGGGGGTVPAEQASIDTEIAADLDAIEQDEAALLAELDRLESEGETDAVLSL